MRKIIAVGFVLLFTAGTALAVKGVDTQGTFLDRVASFFGLRPNDSPKPSASVPSGRKALDSRTPEGGESCTCNGPTGLVQGVTAPDGSCTPDPPADLGPFYQMP